MLELYVAYLVHFKKLKYHTIVCYLNIVSHLHKGEGLVSPVQSWGVKQILRGVKRSLGAAQNCVKPITPHILLHIKAVLSNVLSDKCFWTACIMAFFGLLRPNNFLVTTQESGSCVRRVDVTKIPGGYLVTLNRTKTVQFRECVVKVYLPFVQGHLLCPASVMQNYLLATQDAEPLQPLFIYSHNQPMTYAYFLCKLREVLHRCGLPAHDFGGHSFRRGGATWAFKCGLSEKAIQRLGFWSSDAYARYIDTDSQQMFDEVSHMVAHIT